MRVPVTEVLIYFMMMMISKVMRVPLSPSLG